MLSIRFREPVARRGRFRKFKEKSTAAYKLLDELKKVAE
jgi:hypothetical protein